MLDNAMLKDIASKNGAVRREARGRRSSADLLRGERTAGVRGARGRSHIVRYRSNRPDDAAVRMRLRELPAIRRRIGYRHLLVLMRRAGPVMNHKKFRRLYCEERLQVHRRGGRKRALGTRAPLSIP